MEQLTILEKESLEILKELERCCEAMEENPSQVEKEKCVKVMFTELNLVDLKNFQRTQDVVYYLQRNGVNFVITFDLINDTPDMYIDDEHPSGEYIELGRIKGENLEEITFAVQSLIQKLTQKTTLQTIEKKENILVTNKKRTTLPKFQRTDWSKVSIKFIDERNFVLSNSIETKPCIPESLGCLDNRNQKPDGAWKFLLKVANGNGITNSIGKKEREKQKKHKQRATDILRMIFNDDTDPFEKEKGGVYKAKFRIGFTEDDSPKTKGKREYLDLDEVRKEMTGE